MKRFPRLLPILFNYGGIITTPIFIVIIVVVTWFYVDNPWQTYAKLSSVGFIIGLIFSIQGRYEFIDKNEAHYEVIGVPFPVIIFENGADFPVIWGLILNPLYFILLVNAVYLATPFIGDTIIVILFWVILILLVFMQLTRSKSPKEPK